MGLFMAIIALILGFIFKYAKDIFQRRNLRRIERDRNNDAVSFPLLSLSCIVFNLTSANVMI